MECTGCGSAMRDDQRICLQCGEMVRKRVAPGDRLQAVPAGVPSWIAFEDRGAGPVDLPASRISRIMAFVVDSVILGVASTLAISQFASEAAFEVDSSSGASFSDFGIPIWLVVAMFVTQAAYGIIFPATPWQGTPGKKLLGLRITNLEGERMNIVQSFFRYLCYTVFWGLFVPLMMFVGILVFAIAIAVIFLMGDGRSPWDSMAGTKVVD